LEVAKVNGKTPNFHSFLGILREIGLFSLVFAGFSVPTGKLRRNFGRIFPAQARGMVSAELISGWIMRFCGGEAKAERNQGSVLCGMMDAGLPASAGRM
jgi:hypothetical protein